jgi:CBS domain containing-hemolysin-like protein
VEALTGPAWALVAVAGGLLLVALAGAAEAALAATSRGRLAVVPAGATRRRLAERLLDDGPRTAAALLTLDTLGLLVAVAGAAAAGLPLAAGPGSLAVAAAAAVVAALLVRLPARLVAARHPEGVALRLAPVVDAVARALAPGRVAVVWLLARLAPEAGERDGARLREESLRELVQAGEEGRPLEDEEMEMIAGIFELGETRVREVMVPRIDVVSVSIDATIDEVLDTILGGGHSRIPVHRGTIDDVAGLLYAKDLLGAFRDRDYAPNLGRLLREPYFVPESKPVDQLLAELQRRKVHMAIVVDEYGGTAGLVTIEDLLEEIVGEIQDEYDVEVARYELSAPGEGVFLAGMDIDDVNRLLALDLPTEDVDTLAGLVFTRLGRVPEVGERAYFDDAEIEVLAVHGRRIHQVRVRARPAEAPGADGAEPGVPPEEAVPSAVEPEAGDAG